MITGKRVAIAMDIPKGAVSVQVPTFKRISHAAPISDLMAPAM
jgi:hypothetical protein